ncbi:MAG: MoaD/ThiS family protein [Acidimicrobiia bacterium]
MAKLRLFANLRELAGASRLELPGDTVGEVIDEAKSRFGSDFEKGLSTSRIWVNGEEADMAARVFEGDEVVVLPPVSGGGQPTTLAMSDVLGALSLVAALVAVLANTQSQAVWAAALVAIAAAWALDISSTFTARGRLFAPMPVVATAAGGALLAHILGGAGYGLTVTAAVATALGWALAFPIYRQVDVFSPTLMVALLAGMGTASMILSRSAFAPDARVVDVFLVGTIAGVALGSLVLRLPPLPYLDPFSTTAIVAVLGFVAGAAIWDLDVVGYLLVGLGVAVALVAGNGLSSMLRSGQVALTLRAPGALVGLDGVVLAAALYYPLVRIIL